METKINTTKASEEVLNWLIANVENYIDNHAKQFKLDLIIDKHNKEMPELKKLQDLYRKLPDKDIKLPNSVKTIEDAEKAIKSTKYKSILKEATEEKKLLDNITKEIFSKINKNKELLDKLFVRMAFYYELVGFNNGKPIMKQISGAISVTNFDYEAFDVDVKIKTPTYYIRNEETNEIEKIVGDDKEYTIQEGFTVWIEISFVSDTMTSLF
jgi:hypothetical protein